MISAAASRHPAVFKSRRQICIPTQPATVFEPGALPVAVDSDALGADQPFYFSVKEPEGNYQVTVAFGSATAASDNTVKAELRRLMLEKIHTDPGQSITRSFIVNVRIPQFPGGQVRLKAPRETTQEARAWDDKLTIEFNHDETNSAVSKVEIEKVDVPTIYILGDSTVCDQSGETWNSWGQMLHALVRPRHRHRQPCRIRRNPRQLHRREALCQGL